MTTPLPQAKVVACSVAHRSFYSDHPSAYKLEGCEINVPGWSRTHEQLRRKPSRRLHRFRAVFQDFCAQHVFVALRARSSDRIATASAACLSQTRCPCTLTLGRMLEKPRTPPLQAPLQSPKRSKLRCILAKPNPVAPCMPEK